jgi:hypothetical protein
MSVILAVSPYALMSTAANVIAMQFLVTCRNGIPMHVTLLALQVVVLRSSFNLKYYYANVVAIKLPPTGYGQCHDGWGTILLSKSTTV